MFFESFLLNLMVIVFLILALIFDYVTKFFSYWYVRHISYKTPLPFFGSDYHRVLGVRNNTDEVNHLYRKYPNEKYVGCIKSRIPELIIKDSEALKTILSTEFKNFGSRGLALENSQDVCVRNNLFFAEGEKWTVLREKLESVLKSLTWRVQDINDCLSGINGDNNVQELLTNILDGAFEELLLDENKNTEEGSLIRKIRLQAKNRTFVNKLKSYIMAVFPSLYVLFGLFMLPGEPTNKSLDAIKNSKLMREVENNGGPPVTNIKDKLNKKQVNSSMYTFSVLSMFIHKGYIPCHSLLTALLYELAKNPEIQQKTRTCIKNCGQENYLDKVIKEVSRLYPPFSTITRKCVKTYKFPENGLLIDRGVTITIPVEALHRDGNNYKLPEVFDPDRFSNDDHCTSFSYLPYGAGPRKCIGEELSLQIIRSVTRTVLLNYDLTTSSKTPKNLKLCDHNFGRLIENDVWLRFQPIQSTN